MGLHWPRRQNSSKPEKQNTKEKKEWQISIQKEKSIKSRFNENTDNSHSCDKSFKFILQISQEQKKCHSQKCSLEWKQKLSCSKLTVKSKSQNEISCPFTYFAAIRSFQYIYQSFLLQLKFCFSAFFNPSFLHAPSWILIALIPLSTHILCCPGRNIACLTRRATKGFLAYSKTTLHYFYLFFINYLYKGH